jgi:branched-chain amino acid transport system ATP-binding protein
MLKIEHLHVCYQNLHALDNVSIDVAAGEIVTLIGANGSGKSTVLKAISGLVRPTEGAITYLGENIRNCRTEDLVSRGISHAPEGRRIFPGLTVYGNLEVATTSWRRWGESIEKELERVLGIFPELKKRIDQLGWSLSGGEQQMLAIARSLMTRPKLLLLDEPSLGLAPKLVASVFDTIKMINRQGTTILLVEQNAYSALQIAHRGYVLANGKIVLAGTAKDLATSEKIKEAYLGG